MSAQSDDVQKPNNGHQPNQNHDEPAIEEGPAPEQERDELPGIEAANAGPAPAPSSQPASASQSAPAQKSSGSSSTNSEDEELLKRIDVARKNLPFETDSLSEVLLAYKDIYPERYKPAYDYITHIATVSKGFLLPKTNGGHILENVAFIKSLFDRTQLIPNEKNKTILSSATPGGEIYYSQSGLKYAHKDFSFSPEKNKTLFTTQDAFNMALHARHRPDMLPPNAIKLTGGVHYRAMMQRAIDAVNHDLPENAKIHITNRLDDLKVTRHVGPLNPDDYKLAKRSPDQPTQEKNPASAAGATTGKPPVQEQPPESSAQAPAQPKTAVPTNTSSNTAPPAAEEQPKSTTENPAPDDAPQKAPDGDTTNTAPVDSAPADSAPPIAKPEGKYLFADLDDTIKADHIAQRRSIKGNDYAEENIQNDWDNRGENSRRLDVARLQARQFEKQIADSADVTQIAKQIGVTIENPNLSVYEGEFSYEPHGKDATATVRFVIEDNNKPMVLRIANHGPYAEYNSHKFKLDDKPKTDFENGASGDAPGIESAPAPRLAAGPTSAPPPAPAQP